MRPALAIDFVTLPCTAGDSLRLPAADVGVGADSGPGPGLTHAAPAISTPDPAVTPDAAQPAPPRRLGRKRLAPEVKRAERLVVRTRHDEQERWKAAASLSGLKLSPWVIRTLQAESRRVLGHRKDAAAAIDEPQTAKIKTPR